MSFIPAGFEDFIAPDCDRLSYIVNRLEGSGFNTALITDEDSRHIYVPFPSSAYNPLFKIKTVIAHYDRVPGSVGANDNSAACFQIMEWALRLRSFPGTHNVRIIFTDGEELGGVRDLGSYSLASRFRRLGITADDVYVFDCCGRGDVLVLSDREGLPPGNAQFIRHYGSLIRRTRSLAAQVTDSKWMSLPVPYSDNAGFIASGIPAVALTILPHEEAYAYALTRGGLSSDTVLRNCQSVRQSLPRTWKLIHSQEDRAETLSESAFKLMARLLDTLTRTLTPA